MDGQTIMRGLIERGYSPVQAAALAGNILQESGGDSSNVNPREDAHGLYQLRMDRWEGLKKFAAERGVDPTDANLQLDYIGREMAGPEKRAGSAFLAATDLPSANAALKSFIRYGDDSQGRRLDYARGLLGQAPSSAASPSPAVAPSTAAGPTSQPATPAPDDTSVADALAAVPKQIASQEVAPMQLQPISAPVPLPQMIRAKQLAQAMLARSLNPQGTQT
jgi:hypothetical protein